MITRFRFHRPALIASLCGLILATAFIGCGASTTAAPPSGPGGASATAVLPGPDLLPVPGPNGSFCRFDSSGYLTITVKNHGTKASGAATLSLNFTTGDNGSGSETEQLDPIQPGQSADLSLPVLRDPFIGLAHTFPVNLTISIYSGQITDVNPQNDTKTVQCNSASS